MDQRIKPLWQSIQKFVEARHRQGHSSYNIETAAAEAEVVTGLNDLLAMQSAPLFQPLTAAEIQSLSTVPIFKTVAPDVLEWIVHRLEWEHRIRADEILETAGVSRLRNATALSAEITSYAVGCASVERVLRGSDGSHWWAVRDDRSVLNKQGTWEIEPLPSNRDESFYQRCRFDSARAAIEAAQAALDKGVAA